jgi:hypothetical protein
MEAIRLRDDQIIRIGNYPAPNVPGYNSLFFHDLTRGHDTSIYKEWGSELTRICTERNIEYYYFYNDYKTKIHVYPEEIIEEWWYAQ